LEHSFSLVIKSDQVPTTLQSTQWLMAAALPKFIITEHCFARVQNPTESH